MTLRAGSPLVGDASLQARVCYPKLLHKHHQGSLCGSTNCMVSAILELDVSVIADSTHLGQCLHSSAIA